MVADNVRWRSGASRRPPVSIGNRWVRRSASDAGVSSPIRLAASSSARGRPSSAATMRPTAGIDRLVEDESWLHRGGPLCEQLHGVERTHLLCSTGKDGNGHGLERVSMLARDPQRHSARREENETGRCVEQGSHHRRRVDHLFDVVQYEQQLAILQMVLQGLGHVLTWNATDLQGSRRSPGSRPRGRSVD